MLEVAPLAGSFDQRLDVIDEGRCHGEGGYLPLQGDELGRLQQG